MSDYMRCSDHPLVTVCICTRDRPEFVGVCLDGLDRQSVAVPAFEIILVDSCSNYRNARLLDEMVKGRAGVELVRVARPGLSVARNAGANAARGEYIAYVDDDAVPDADWIEQIKATILHCAIPPAVLGGRILPVWEKELPAWWPSRLRGVLSIIEYEGSGEYRSKALPPGLEPYGANMVVRRSVLLESGGFNEFAGRTGSVLLSDEDVQLAWGLQNTGYLVLYESRITVRHHIQPSRLNPKWLLSRLYWQGVSTVFTKRLLGEYWSIYFQLARRVFVCLILLPGFLVSRDSTKFIACRWRLAYSLGFVKAALLQTSFSVPAGTQTSILASLRKRRT